MWPFGLLKRRRKKQESKFIREANKYAKADECVLYFQKPGAAADSRRKSLNLNGFHHAVLSIGAVCLVNVIHHLNDDSDNELYHHTLHYKN